MRFHNAEFCAFCSPRGNNKVILTGAMTSSQPVYEIRTRKDKRGVDLLSDALPFGRLWYDGPNAVTNATGYAIHDSRSANAVIRVYDEAGNVIETHDHAGDFKEP